MYTVTYHPDIPADIKRIPNPHKQPIQTAIEQKLTSDPVLYGKPLQFSLSGLRSLRVGNYRVVFQLLAAEVYVVLIAHRSIMYTAASKRR